MSSFRPQPHSLWWRCFFFGTTTMKSNVIPLKMKNESCVRWKIWDCSSWHIVFHFIDRPTMTVHYQDSFYLYDFLNVEVEPHCRPYEFNYQFQFSMNILFIPYYIELWVVERLSIPDCQLAGFLCVLLGWEKN